jgi:hypothetical protein
MKILHYYMYRISQDMLIVILRHIVISYREHITAFRVRIWSDNINPVEV